MPKVSLEQRMRASQMLNQARAAAESLTHALEAARSGSVVINVSITKKDGQTCVNVDAPDLAEGVTADQPTFNPPAEPSRDAAENETKRDIGKANEIDRERAVTGKGASKKADTDDADATDYESWTVEKLKQHGLDNEIEVKGSGANGSAVKADYVKAFTKADKKAAKASDA